MNDHQLPPPSWGQRLAGRIQGLTLIVLALTVLVTALGKLDDVLSFKLRQDILHGFVVLGLIERQPTETLPSQTAWVNFREGRENDTAILSIPNDVDLVNVESLYDDTPTGEANMVGTWAKKTDENGIITLTLAGIARSRNDGGNSGAKFHLRATVLPKHMPMTVTPLGKWVFGGLVALGIVSAVIGPVRRRPALRPQRRASR
ncbi:hypothetical protein [Paraburkholderia youngii]|uniref:hypothetical protein n=1 Tax=Paraburkholderia youngii TaxID=2782701 RepID=UPI003D19A031